MRRPTFAGPTAYESLKKEWIATANELVDALKKIKDESTAKEGGPKLKKLNAKFDDIKSRQGKLVILVIGDFTKIGDIDQRYAKEFSAAIDGWAREETRVHNKVKGGPEALKELK